MDNLDWLDDAYKIEYLTIDEIVERYENLLTEEQIKELKEKYL